MKKKIKSILIFIFLVFILKEMLIHSNLIMETVTLALNIWLKNVFPSLFPFFIISGLLTYYGFPELISELFKPLFCTLFKCKKEGAFVFFMSMISGSPGNAKCLKELYEKKLINENDATKILMFTHFSSPMFILGTISYIFIQNKKCALIILISHYLGNIIIGILFRNYYPYNENKSISFKKTINNLFKEKKDSIGTIITNILINSINTIILILGIITIFLLLTTIINENISLNNYHQSLLSSLFEMTQGLKYLSSVNISLKLKTILTSMIISFGGLSIHMQIISILNNIKIKYHIFLTARLIHALISGLIVYLII